MVEKYHRFIENILVEKRVDILLKETSEFQAPLFNIFHYPKFYSMNNLQDFFLFCSGSNKTILKKTPTEINKHTGIGATIFFTGIFAAIAGGYACFTIFNSYFIAIVVGLLWGAMIFNLDRYIVSTLKMRRSIFRNIFGALPRIALAALIAVVIAKPLELKIFDSEIQAELALMQQENIIEQENLLRSRFENDISQTKLEIANLKGELKTQETKRDELDAIAIQEADGTGGSQIRNMGPIYKAKKADALKAQSELDALEAQLLPQIAAKEIQLTETTDKMNAELTALKQASLTGFAARLEALDRLSQKSSAMYYANVFIMLLFIAIETTPIFVKLISTRSPYDYSLDKHEHVFAMDHHLKTSLLANEIGNRVNYDTEVSSYRTKIAIKKERKRLEEAFGDTIENIKGDKKAGGNIFGIGG